VERSSPGMPRILVALAALMLVAVACAGPAESPAAGTPGTGESPAAGTPATGESPAAESPAAESPAAESPAGETPMGSPEGESPAAESPAAESPAAESPAAGTPGAMPTFENIGGRVSIMASWTGSEEDSFREMLAPWMEMTGVELDYTGTRDMQAQLTAAIQAGGTGLPDVAGIPGPGLAVDWYDAGALKALDDAIDVDAYTASSAPGMAELGIHEDGSLMGVFTKAAVKGLTWYNTNVYDGTVPGSWDELQGMDPAPAGSLWCNAFEGGAASGWPGTDWIEDIVIRQSGPDVYDAWVNGEHAWTSPEIRSAFEVMAQVIETSAGGGTAINATNFGDVGNGMFTDPPDCKFVHQASFISDFFINQAGAAEGDFDFFVMPDIDPQYAGALTGGGDMFGMFNDTPQARSLMQWLVTAEAQQIWAERGGFIAANTDVPTEVYASPSDQKAAAALQEASAFRFDGSDQMPGEMNDAFFTAMVDFASNPGDIDTILQRLDQTQQQAYANGGASPSP
jgi:alpha-glucoside transport system substrate-binding protein